MVILLPFSYLGAGEISAKENPMISNSELAITRVRELRMLMSCLNINLAGHAKISNTVRRYTGQTRKWHRGARLITPRIIDHFHLDNLAQTVCARSTLAPQSHHSSTRLPLAKTSKKRKEGEGKKRNWGSRDMNHRI